MTRSLLIYDGSTPGFDAVGRLLASGAEDLKAVAWESAPVQSFLDAQFDDRPFAFILVEAETVYVGRDAVERLLGAYGLEQSVTDLVGRAYPPFSVPFGRLVHGTEPADLHGTFPLEPAAREHLDTLRRRHDIPVETE